MAKGDPKKPKGKMSAYAFFVQTCREEHKKKNPEVPVNFAEFSKKCSERWKVWIWANSNEMSKDYGPAKGGKKKKDPNAPKRPPSGFFLFCSEFRPKIKSTNPGISIGDVAKKLGEMWNNLSDGEKQPYNNKAGKLKEKYEKVSGAAGTTSSYSRKRPGFETARLFTATPPGQQRILISHSNAWQGKASIYVCVCVYKYIRAHAHTHIYIYTHSRVSLIQHSLI
uniref:High mobility group box 3 n=1 Tax=Anolis carolinensis TaxID=28377 RepID=A0A803TS61_ANOCA